MRLGQPAQCCVNGEAAISNYCSGSKIRGISVVVIPAPAGIHPRNKRRPARLPGNCRPLDKRSASFEASLREAPQDDEFFRAINDIPHAEERPTGRVSKQVQP